MQFYPTGTVYATLLNFRSEFDALTPQMDAPPHKGAPREPILYVKTANTWSACRADIAVPHHVPQVEIGATIGLVFGPFSRSDKHISAIESVANYVLFADFSIPHASFFRPPVKFKCLDGFLGVGDAPLAAAQGIDPSTFVLEVLINGELRQRVDFAQLMRPAAQLVADVRAFMTLHPGDVLLLGCDIGPEGHRPRARVGDVVTICSPSHPALGTLSHRLIEDLTAKEAA